MNVISIDIVIYCLKQLVSDDNERFLMYSALKKADIS